MNIKLTKINWTLHLTWFTSNHVLKCKDGADHNTSLWWKPYIWNLTGSVIKTLISVIPSSSISSAHSFSCSSLIWRAKLLKTFSSSFVDTRPSPFLSKRLKVLCASAKQLLICHVLHVFYDNTQIKVGNFNDSFKYYFIIYPWKYQKHIKRNIKRNFFLN